MIVAVAFGNLNGDTPSVFVVDTDKCTLVWSHAILESVAKRPELTSNQRPKEWESLRKAQVPLPTRIDAATFVYYGVES